MDLKKEKEKILQQMISIEHDLAVLEFTGGASEEIYSLEKEYWNLSDSFTDISLYETRVDMMLKSAGIYVS